MFGRFKKVSQKQEKFKEEEVSNHFEMNQNEFEKNQLYIKAMIGEKKIPIVVIDALWYGMKEYITTASIEEKEKQLNELMKEQGKLNTDTIEYAMVKKNLLQKILNVSQEVNEQGDTTKLNELDTLHQTIIKTNETLEQIEERVEQVEKLIEETNRALVEEAMVLAYGYMARCNNKQKVLEDEIDYLRQQVVIKTQEKKACNQEYSILYNYLHKIIGYKYVDQIDKKLGDKKE